MDSINTLYLTGGDHYALAENSEIIAEAFQRFEGVSLEITDDRNALKADNLARYSAVVIHTQGGQLTTEQEQGLIGLIQGGGGLVGLHSISDSFKTNEKFIDLIGGRFADHGPTHCFEVKIERPEHPIMTRIDDFEIFDELYVLDRFDPQKVEVLASAVWKGRAEPMIFVKRFGKGHVIHNALGHGPEAFSHPVFQKIVHRSIRYAARSLPQPKTLRVAVVGYSMGEFHLETIKTIPGLKPVAVCDLDPRRVEAAKKAHPVLNTYTDLDALLDKEDVELVSIVTPHDTHADLTIRTLQANRHTVVEKPMAVTVEQCNAMIEAARKSGRMLSVFHNRRWDADYMTIRSEIQKGTIGKVFQLETSFGGYEEHGYHRPNSWWRSEKQSSGGLLYDWGAHYVDKLLGFVSNKVLSVEGFFQKQRWWHVTNEDHLLVVIRFEDGAVAVLEQSNIAALGGKPNWRIMGSRGEILLEQGNPSAIQLACDADGQLIQESIPIGKSRPEQYYRNVADHLIYGEPLAVSPESARRVIAIIETAGRSSQAGKPMPLPYENEFTDDRFL